MLKGARQEGVVAEAPLWIPGRFLCGPSLGTPAALLTCCASTDKWLEHSEPQMKKVAEVPLAPWLAMWTKQPSTYLALHALLGLGQGHGTCVPLLL